ncbi:MAG: RNA-guided endonuclease IscB [Pseudohongiella sp.]|nr:RNA-guided endonuclease IscB [Pseudohongiella sp.]
MAVFVLDKRKRPMMPCTEKRARLLLSRGNAVVHLRKPFTIRLKHRVGGDVQPTRLKLDPGSKTTGVALVREVIDGQHVLTLIELCHRGAQISKSLMQRRGLRRRRRSKLRYRPARFNNRKKPEGWLAPSLQHRVDTTVSLVKRLQKLVPVIAISQELVRFDMQRMDNPGIQGIEYQQGELAGYEVREYLLEKWGRACVYCDKTNIPLQVEHIVAKGRGGSNRISNLTIACGKCNQEKDQLDLSVFLVHEPARHKYIVSHSKKSMRAAAAVNVTRWALNKELLETGLPVEIASGGRTKFNRSTLGIPKSHALDAACVGEINSLHNWQNQPTLKIRCAGRGSYKRTLLTKHGFPRGYLMREKQVYGFQTGDYVRANVPAGVKAGIYIGRVAVRASGYFNIQVGSDVVQGIAHRHCRLIQRVDGYGYSHSTARDPRSQFLTRNMGKNSLRELQ